MNDIVELLYDKYGITRPEEIYKFDWDDGRFAAERPALLKGLHDAVGKIFTEDAIMRF